MSKHMKGSCEEKGLSVEELEARKEEILDDIEAGEFDSIDNVEEKMAVAREAARKFTKRDARINIRVSGADLRMIQCLAAQEGIPYQTFLSSMIHKLASGRLKQA